MGSQTRPLAFIIEDDISLTDIFSQAMKQAGFNTQAVADGQEALDRLATIEPKVIILDLYLPSVSGDKILTYIRNDRRLKKTIVVLTTFDSLLADSLREHCDFVMLKPVSFIQLRDLGSRVRMSL